MVQQDQQISEAIERERPRLRNSIRNRVADQTPSSARSFVKECMVAADHSHHPQQSQGPERQKTCGNLVFPALE